MSRPRSWKQWAASALGTSGLVASTACVLWVVAGERAELERALELDAGTVLAVASLMGFAHALRAYEFTFLLARLGVPERFRDGFLLTAAGFLLNHLPFNAGFVARGIALKRQFSLDYTAYASLTLVSGVVNLGTAAFAAAISLAFGIAGPGATAWLLPVLVLLGVICFAVLSLPLPGISSGSCRGALFLRSLAGGVVKIRSRAHSLTVLVALSALRLTSVAVRLGLCFQAFRLAPPPAALLALAAASTLLSLASLTPGNLGLRELTLGLLSAQFGIPPALGLAAASVDRAVLLAYTVIVGIPGIVVLRERLRTAVGGILEQRPHA